jgi:hypothetical protein
MPTEKNAEENPVPPDAIRITLDGDKVTLKDIDRFLTAAHLKLDATDRVLRAIVKTFPSEAREQGARKP